MSMGLALWSAGLFWERRKEIHGGVMILPAGRGVITRLRRR